jgi:RHS repeat-associated protein
MKREICILLLVIGSMVAPEILFFGVGFSNCSAQQSACVANLSSSHNHQRPIDYASDPGERVSMANGCYHFSVTDLSLPGPVPIVLTRYYDSSMEYAGPMGNNFEFSFNRRLLIDGNRLYYYTGKGYRVPVAPVLVPGGGDDMFIPTRDHYQLSTNSYGGVTVTDKSGSQDIMNSSGLLIKSIDRNNNELDFTRDDNGNLISVVDPVDNRSITFSRDPSTQLITSATDSTGRTVSYSYGTTVSESDVSSSDPFLALNPYGMVKITYPATSDYPLGTAMHYGYDVFGRMTNQIDGNGNTILTNVYSPFYYLAGANGSFNPLPTNYSLASQTKDGGTTTYAYTTVAYGSTTAIAAIKTVDAKGYETDSFNDVLADTSTSSISAYNVSKMVVHTAGLHSGEPATYETDYGYEYPGGTLLQDTDPRGEITTYTYDNMSNVLSTTKTAPAGSSINAAEGTQSLSLTTSNTYEPRFNQVLTTTDPNGNVTTNDYGNATSNPTGNLLSTTYPTTAAGTAVERFTYNSLGQVLTDTTPDGTVTQNTYDPSTGYLTQTVKDYGSGKLNATTQFTYDSYGHVLSTTDADGHTKTTLTNGRDQITEVDGASGEVEQRLYDADGMVVTDQKQAPGSQWEKTVNVYNSYEQLVATQDYTDETAYLETDYTYDLNGNRYSVKDPLDHTTTTAYDERNKPYLMTDALGKTRTLDFDGNENTIRLTDELGHISTYAYDGLDKLEQKNFPDGSYQTWKYDSDGNITGMRTTGGNLIAQTYDARDRMLTQAYGTSTIADVYDIMGRILTSTEGGTALVYIYDDLGRNTSFTDQAGRTSTYSYDLVGNRTSTTYPTGVTVARAHDASNRVTTLKDGAGTTQATYSYDILDRPTGMALANSTSVAWNHDLLDRLTSVNNTLGGMTTRNYSYIYDAASRRTSESGPRGTVGYAYTDRNEVNAVSEPSGSPFSDQSFAYDAGYNRSNWTYGSTATSYAVNNLNQYTTVSSDAAPTWNGDGGLAVFHGNTYTYDALMRLTEVDNAVGKYLFSYDPLGRRVKKVIESPSGSVLETYGYHYDSSEVAVEYQPATTWTYYLGLGIDQVVMRSNSTTKQWYYANDQGSISAVADNSGNLLEQYEYDAQGQVSIANATGTVQTGTQIDNSILYTGRSYDAETGNYFYRARYYSPYLGRFISRDPLSGAEFSQGTNLYAYCENNYTDLDDPTGESWQGFLDGAGTIPVLNEITDPINAAVSISQGDWVGAGLAIGGMAPGLGEGADVLKAGRDIVKATEEAGKITKNAEHVAKGGICFAMGTLISTPDGEKKIENIRKGDVVYCYDFKKHEVVKSHVLAIYRNTTSEWQRLQFAAGDTLQCTPKHPFWIVAQHAWVEASSLKVGAVVLLENGQEGTLTKSSIRHLSKPETTYNFNVERVHDYFVGNSQILVHNSCMAAEGGTTTVGRYMSQAELDAMKAEGKVQESLNNGVTSVTHPPSPTAYANAPKGDIYTEFDVPKSAINAADGTTAKIYGPNSIFGPKLNINEMPPATNIRTP